MKYRYPFTAVVGGDPDSEHGLDDMALALILTAISPDIGGVLVRGEKGTAKSTLVRALAAVLPPIEVIEGDRFSSDPADPEPLSPDAPYGPDARAETRPVRLVELPVGATEDRLVGSINVEQALTSGSIAFEPGLVAQAHRGILYVDEVNLLHDHLVDLLLDAAAMGQQTVERDGLSITHAARFVLIGTMNPEEGELRPQLLDRFGLTAEISAPNQPAYRVEVVRRRLAFDADPASFCRTYQYSEDSLRQRISSARGLMPEVQITDDSLLQIAEVCSAFGVDGLRADIVTARAAIAHAAWDGRRCVTVDDIRVAARLALPHRRRRNPFDAPGIDDDVLDELLPQDSPPHGDQPDGPDDDGPGSGEAAPGADDKTPFDGGPDHAPDASSTAESNPGAPTPVSTVGAQKPFAPRLFAVGGVGVGQAGRRSRAQTRSGLRIGVVASAAEGAGLHLTGTVFAAAKNGGRGSGRLRLCAEDLRWAVREGRESNLVLFVVDMSGSVAARERMQSVKTAILSLLLDAYRRRDRIGLITFRGSTATLALPPTKSVDIAARRLDDLPAGGRTPLAEGLLETLDVTRREQLRDPSCRPLLIVITDARATAGTDALARSRQAADLVADRGMASVVIDCESGAMRLGLAQTLAERLRADYVKLAHLEAGALTQIVRDTTEKGAA